MLASFSSKLFFFNHVILNRKFWKQFWVNMEAYCSVFQHMLWSIHFFPILLEIFYNLTTTVRKCPFFVSDVMYFCQLGPVKFCFVRPSLCLNWNVHSIRFIQCKTLIWQKIFECVGLNILPFVLNYPLFTWEKSFLKKSKSYETKTKHLQFRIANNKLVTWELKIW